MSTLFLQGEAVHILDAPVTYLLLVLIGYTSYKYMEDYSADGKGQLMLYPYGMSRRKEWYRFFSMGFVHGDWLHLGFNSFVLLAFGGVLEVELSAPWRFGQLGHLVFLGLFITGLPMASLYSYFSNKDNAHYRALGASGAVSAIVFAMILLSPISSIGFILLPEELGIPGFIFGILYLMFSAYMNKRGGDNIAHDAHYWGSIWGIVYLIALKPSIGMNSLMMIRTYILSFF